MKNRKRTLDIRVIQSLQKKLNKSIFAQDEAISTLVDYITISAVGLNNKEKPIGSFLFTGPTGVGKTELAKQLAKNLNLHFQRFDMSEYSTERSADNLIGGAAGLVGYDEGGLLTNAILDNPDCILLFDEIEKADKSILNKFLQIMDYGKLTSSKGEEVYFNNTIVIFTSNLGSIKTTRRTAGFGSKTYIETENGFDEYLSPEFIGRINQIVEFNPTNKEISKMIVKKFFNQIEEMLKNRNISVKATEDIINKIIENSNSNLGARNLENLITQNIKVIISQELLLGKITNNSIILFDWDKDTNEYKYTIEKAEVLIKIPEILYDTPYFKNAEEAQNYAKQNPGTVIMRDPNTDGYIIKE